jgi:AhpD family alkylhydroperoxidase
MRAVMGPGEVPVLLKELLSVRVSQINQCEY